MGDSFVKLKEQDRKVSKHINNYRFLENFVYFDKVCIHCGKSTSFAITRGQYESWVLEDDYIQNVFPDMNSDEREMMISGTHPECWNEMFPVIEDDEYDDIDYSQFSDEELGFDKE